jgi:hypothetical protein
MLRPNVKWVPCHHGMARPQVADRGDCFHIWRVAANILNKQQRTADSGLYSSFGVRRGANTPTIKRNVRYQKLHTASEHDGLFGTT